MIYTGINNTTQHSKLLIVIDDKNETKVKTEFFHQQCYNTNTEKRLESKLCNKLILVGCEHMKEYTEKCWYARESDRFRLELLNSYLWRRGFFFFFIFSCGTEYRFDIVDGSFEVGFPLHVGSRYLLVDDGQITCK